MSSPLAVQLEGVSKHFGKTRALDAVTVSIPEGSICGVIGPNGSGKTTTLRIILDIVQPESGTVWLFGSQSPGLANNRISYLPEERGLYRKMKVRRQLSYLARLKGVAPRLLSGKIDYWLERVGLLETADMKVEALSKGMAQKIQFIGTLINEPRLLILDEPFSGLDPVNLELIRELILEQKRGGTTILLSTHDMSMAEKLCDSIFMIYQGRKVLDGTLAKIQEQYGTDTVRLRVRPGLTPDDWAQLMGGDGEVDPGPDPKREHGKDACDAPLKKGSTMRDLGRFQEFRGLASALRFLRKVQERVEVEYFEITPPSLHDIFLREVREGGEKQ